MKDAKGHGSDGGTGKVLDRSLAFNPAAHQSMVQKVLATGDVHAAMAHTVTGYDRQQQGRADIKGDYHNPNALGLYLGAVERAAADIKSGASHADAINNNFNGPLANRLHKSLKTGGKDKDSMRRDSFRAKVGDPNARF